MSINIFDQGFPRPPWPNDSQVSGYWAPHGGFWRSCTPTSDISRFLAPFLPLHETPEKRAPPKTLGNHKNPALCSRGTDFG